MLAHELFPPLCIVSFKSSEKCINNRHPYSVQPSRYFIRIIIKFSSCMKLGHNYFCCDTPSSCLSVGIPLPLSVNNNTVVRKYFYCYFIAVSSKCLIYRVIYHFVDHVMKACAIISVSYTFWSFLNSF